MYHDYCPFCGGIISTYDQGLLIILKKIDYLAEGEPLPEIEKEKHPRFARISKGVKVKSVIKYITQNQIK